MEEDHYTAGEVGTIRAQRSRTIDFEKEWFEFLKAHPGDDPDEAVGAFGEAIWKKALESDQKYTAGFEEGMKQGREDGLLE